METQAGKDESEKQLQEIRLLVDTYVYFTVTADGPDWFACPIYKQLLGDEKEYEAICAEMPLTFAPGLFEVLKAPQPPSTSFFTTTPKVPDHPNLWGVYGVLMECPDQPPKLYIGSGTDGTSSIRSRARTYEKWQSSLNSQASATSLSSQASATSLNSQASATIFQKASALPAVPAFGSLQLIPKHMRTASAKGYTITHCGMLAWMPLPMAKKCPKARVRLYAVEAALCFIFFAAFESKIDGPWMSFIPWTREQVAWMPLCSHSALQELPAGQHGLTEAELEKYNEERQVKAKQRMLEAGRAFVEREKAKDFDAYMARKRKDKFAWSKRNPERVLEIAAGVRSRALATGKHTCIECNRPFSSSQALRTHKESGEHKETLRVLAGGRVRKASAEAQKAKESRANTVASGKFHCNLCDHTSGSLGHFGQHKGSSKHWKLIEKLEKTDPAAAAAERAESQPYVKHFCEACQKPFGSHSHYTDHTKSDTHKRKYASMKGKADVTASPYAPSQASAAPSASLASPYAPSQASAAPSASLASPYAPSQASAAPSASLASPYAPSQASATPSASLASPYAPSQASATPQASPALATLSRQFKVPPVSSSSKASAAQKPPAASPALTKASANPPTRTRTRKPLAQAEKKDLFCEICQTKFAFKGHFDTHMLKHAQQDAAADQTHL